MPAQSLSILIPVYNEAGTVHQLITQVCTFDFGQAEVQIIVVDDCSNDGSSQMLKQLAERYGFTLLTHPRNRGKGAAIRTALTHATGEYAIIQDADLEYRVSDIAKLLNFAVENSAPIVFGSRELLTHKHSSRLFLWGGKLITQIANLLYGLSLTDEPTCYKLIRTDILKSLHLQCERFEFCPEVTAKLARLGYPIPEIPISYQARRPGDGKKIRYRDGWQALITLIRYVRWKP